MCGINGYLDYTNRIQEAALRDIVHGMNERIIHRGPDDEGIYYSHNLCMGMRRLSIIDLKSGHQPIYNEDRSLAIVFNGEIYNFLELKNDLKTKGHTFYTNADTEVIVHLFEEYGTNAFDMLDGMFAFALHDKKDNSIYLVRDRMGEKPLYYSSSKDFFIFGSELKSLMGLNLVEQKLDKRALNQFVQLTYIPAPLSIYENVFKLEPGHFIKVLPNGTIENYEYWDIPVKTDLELNYKDAVNKLRELIFHSVSNKMISDVPLGAFLSGGVDSASIVGTMQKVGNEPVKTFTIGSNVKEYDERERARSIAQHFNTDHHEKVVDYNEFPKVMYEIVAHMDEPFADSSAIPTYVLSNCVSKDVKVALTGDAGDELFAGYNKYLASYYCRKISKFPDGLTKLLMKITGLIFGNDGELTRKVCKVLLNAKKSPCERHLALMHMGVKEEEIISLMTDEYYDSDSLNFIEQYFNKNKGVSELQRELYTDLKVVLEGDMLVKVDRMSMLNSLETRTALLSKDIIEFSMSLPDDYKLRGKTRKRILKDAMGGFLPAGYTKGKKKGFEVPVSNWLKEEMRDDLENLLSEERIISQGIFNYKYINKLKQEHFSGIKNRRDELWTLYVFEKWYEKEIG